MSIQAPTTKVVMATVEGQKVHVEVSTPPGQGDSDVAFEIPTFDTVMPAITAVARVFTATLEKIQPTKASMEFGIELALDSGKLTAIIVKGTAKANLKVALEFSRSLPAQTPPPA